MGDQQRASGRDSGVSDRGLASSWPGAVPGGTLAVLSGVVCWFWLFPQLTTGARLGTEGAGAANVLAEVDDAELAGALSTMDLPGNVATALQKGTRDCGARLAWVTLSQPGGGAGQTVRLRSGSYFSPTFTITAAPVRVAIPYPAPYASGRGNLTVLGSTGDLTVALSPAWHVTAATATQAVSWTTAAGCKKP